jgi:hypothetical protein
MALLSYGTLPIHGQVVESPYQTNKFDLIGEIGNTFNNVFSGVGNLINSAFDSSKHGIFSGSYDDFKMGFNRTAGLIPEAWANNAVTVSQGLGQAGSNILTPLSYNPSFYLIMAVAILGLGTVAYTVFKIGKYV